MAETLSIVFGHHFLKDQHGKKTTLLLYKLSIRAPALMLQSFLQIGFWSGLSFVAQQLLTAYLEH